MKQATLLSLCKTKKMTPTILNTADSPHYLLGAEDNNGNFFSFTNEQEASIALNSLELAKQWLANEGINTATFKMDTAYDEMIGISEPSSVRHTLSF